jgi:DNA-binding transcriptional ArsR family regulator
MSLSAEFDTAADRRAFAVVAAGAAVLSYAHARAFFAPFMGPAGASVTPLMLDAVVFWLASANVRQAKAGRPLPMLRAGAYAVLGLAITANALGGATWPQRVFLALPAALFGFLVEARTRLALYQHRAAHGDDRLRLRLWARHPVRTARAWLWLARQSAPAFDRATAERDRLRAARDAVRLALPGRARAIRRARAGVLRELNAGRLTPAVAVEASGLLTRPGVSQLHRAALAAALGGTLPAASTADTAPDTAADPAPATKRTPRRTNRTGTAAAVARLRDRHPDMSAADIARRLGVTDRTVRRHLSARPTYDAPPAVAA